MTGKAAFSDEEWERLRRAPFVVGMALTIADPGGPIEISKEGMATIRSATVPPSQEELLAAVALDIQTLMQQKHNPAKEGGFMGFGAERVGAGEQAMLDQIRGALGQG